MRCKMYKNTDAVPINIHINFNKTGLLTDGNFLIILCCIYSDETPFAIRLILVSR